MTNQTSPLQESFRWSNRILITSLIGIIYLTLFPFRFDFRAHHLLQRSPFLLANSQKYTSGLDFFLNVLLFVPFGAGISAQLRKRRVSRTARLVVALAAGALTSYLVEFLQIYIPMRDSGWNDVISNSLGSVVGFLLFELFGEILLKSVSGWEDDLESWLSLRRLCIFLGLYLGFFFILSVPLQRETRLSNWDATAPLFIGSDGTAQHAWKGKIAKLEIWSRALSDESARTLTSGEEPPDSEISLLASYDFTGAAPYRTRNQSLPALAWISSFEQPHDSRVLDLDGSSWLSSIVPAQDLTRELQKTNQFTVRAVCAPKDIAYLNQQTIFSISQISGLANVTLRQDGPDLFFWVRNPLTEKRKGGTRRAREIYVRDVFVAGQMRDILASYDGSDVSLYVDGQKESRVYSFSPGATLLPMFIRFKGSDWGGDLVLYDSLIFVPAGLLLGMISRKMSLRNLTGYFLLLLWILLPSVLYEFILVWVSGRDVSPWQVSLCLFLTVVGAAWVNADVSDGSLSRNS